MPNFVITALNDRGQRIQQVESADSEREIRERLLQQGFLIQGIREQRNWVGGGRRNRIPPGQFIIFNSQFLTLVRAGMPILRALELLDKRARDARLQTLLHAVRERVQAGDLLSRAFAQQPGIPEIYVTTLLAGEKSGNLEEVLGRYIQYQKLAHSLKRKVIASLIYPAVLMCLVAVVLSFLVTFVVPRFADLYTSLDATLPEITLVVLQIGQTARHYFLPGAVAVVLLVVLAGYMLRREAVGRFIDGIVLRLPLFGDLWWKFQVAMLARTLSTLLLGGIPAVQALETASSALRSPRLRRGLRETVRGVREGEPVSAGLSRHRVVPPLAIEMVEVGEGTGALPQMLSSVAEFYDEDLNNAMQAILSLIEPVILIVVGSIVAVILISLYLPIFSLGSRIST